MYIQANVALLTLANKIVILLQLVHNPKSQEQSVILHCVNLLYVPLFHNYVGLASMYNNLGIILCGMFCEAR